MSPHGQSADDIIRLFNAQFQESQKTVLMRSKDLPMYLPSDSENGEDRILFAHEFFQSALHEISHWCIAGRERRKKIDYGYWYKPDGRNQQEQKCFLDVETKPQALEWIFTTAANRPFFVSLDNLSGASTDTHFFKTKVLSAALDYLKKGLPVRAETFRIALIEKYSSQEKFRSIWQQIQSDKMLPL